MKGKILAWFSFFVPVALLGVLLLVFWRSSGGLRFEAPAPVEQVAFERIVFQPEEIVAHVRNVGPHEVTIAQVQVGWTNRASWEFRVEPSPTISRLGTARVHIPYPWSEGEPYEVVLFTAAGLPFSHQVDVATSTPRFSARGLLSFSMLGVYVGVIPVFLGILWLPFLRQLGPRAYGFWISLTVGLLVFLGVDALHDSFEIAGETPGPFQGVALVLIGVAMSGLGLHLLSRFLERRGPAAPDPARSALVLAYLVAVGIGVHNLGEGLAIGGAYALGKVATGALLIIGFMIHNLTEGVAVVAPIVRHEMGSRAGAIRWSHLGWLGAVAGLPTIAGTSLGAFAPSPVLGLLFLAIGAGAVFQVVIEIVSQMRRAVEAVLLTPANVTGFMAGLAVMYLTGLFLAV